MSARLRVLIVLLGLLALTRSTVAARRSHRDSSIRAVLAAARKAIGSDALKCVTISGTGYDGALGQARLSEKGVDWPRIDALTNYTRTMNWETRTMKEEFDRKPGLNPAGWKPALAGSTVVQKNLHQTFMLSSNTA